MRASVILICIFTQLSPLRVRCVVSDFFWKRPDMASSGFCLLNTAAVAAVPKTLFVFLFC